MIKKLTISSKNITTKQWSILLIELNLIKQAWKSFAKLEINTPGFEKTIKWGKKRHDETKET
jgi:hypothetical protein|tara:strand:- start:1443 stop:1628 length:186 start_codon:yes stop_codon:yes gene_type:complete